MIEALCVEQDMDVDSISLEAGLVGDDDNDEEKIGEEEGSEGNRYDDAKIPNQVNRQGTIGAERRVESSAMLLGETFRGPSGSLHSRFSDGLNLLVQHAVHVVVEGATNDDNEDASKLHAAAKVILPKFVAYILDFLKRERAALFWTSLLHHTTVVLGPLTQADKSTAPTAKSKKGS